jgi:hypothetical protein
MISRPTHKSEPDVLLTRLLGRPDNMHTHPATHSASPKVGLAGSRVRIFGSVLKAESVPKHILESIFRGAWQCVAQHFENAVQSSAKLGRLIISFMSRHFMISRLAYKSEPDFLLTRLLGRQYAHTPIHTHKHTFIHIRTHIHNHTLTHRHFHTDTYTLTQRV